MSMVCLSNVGKETICKKKKKKALYNYIEFGDFLIHFLKNSALCVFSLLFHLSGLLPQLFIMRRLPRHSVKGGGFDGFASYNHTILSPFMFTIIPKVGTRLDMRNLPRNSQFTE